MKFQILNPGGRRSGIPFGERIGMSHAACFGEGIADSTDSIDGDARQESPPEAQELVINDGYRTIQAATKSRGARVWFGFEASNRALEEFAGRTRMQ